MNINKHHPPGAVSGFGGQEWIFDRQKTGAAPGDFNADTFHKAGEMPEYFFQQRCKVRSRRYVQNLVRQRLCREPLKAVPL